MKNEWEQLDDGRIVVWLGNPRRLGGRIRLFATVDESDFDVADSVTGAWYGELNKGRLWYVRTGGGPQGRHEYLHRQLYGLTEFHDQVDHILPYDTLNNCRANLRVCNNRENTLNTHNKHTIPSGAISVPQSNTIFPIVPDHIYEKAGVLHLKHHQQQYAQ